jgi:hypothetical protein
MGLKKRKSLRGFTGTRARGRADSDDMSDSASLDDTDSGAATGTAVKYIGDIPGLKAMSLEDRAAFEYYLLKYDVDKNAAVAASAQGILDIVRNKRLFGNGDVTVYQKASKVVNILIILAFFVVLVCLLVYIIMTFRGMQAENLKLFLFYTLVMCMIVAIMVVIYNIFHKLLTETSSYID